MRKYANNANLYEMGIRVHNTYPISCSENEAVKSKQILMEPMLLTVAPASTRVSGISHHAATGAPPGKICVPHPSLMCDIPQNGGRIRGGSTALP